MKLKLRKWDAHTHLTKKPEHHTADRKAGNKENRICSSIWRTSFRSCTVNNRDPLIDLAIGMSPDGRVQRDSANILPRTLIYSDFSETLFENVVTEQRKRIKQGKPVRRILFFLTIAALTRRKFSKAP